MGLTTTQCSLIKAVAENDMMAAKQYARVCLLEDKTQKNRGFVSRYVKILDNEPLKLEVPYNLKGRIIAEDMSDFRESRYYLSESESELFREISRAKRVSDKLAELNVPYINATMLYGEPGTGKTEFGRYVACKLGLPFIYVNFSNLVDSLMGKTSSNLNLIFNYVKTVQCVFMLDEVDCIAMKRSGDTGPDGELSRIVITLMQEFDNLPNDVIVIGATNRIDKLDKAFLSRFSTVHEVRALDPEESVLMVKKFLDDIGYGFSDEKIRELCGERVQRRIMKAVIRELSRMMEPEI